MASGILKEQVIHQYKKLISQQKDHLDSLDKEVKMLKSENQHFKLHSQCFILIPVCCSQRKHVPVCTVTECIVCVVVFPVRQITVTESRIQELKLTVTGGLLKQQGKHSRHRKDIRVLENKLNQVLMLIKRRHLHPDFAYYTPSCYSVNFTRAPSRLISRNNLSFRETHYSFIASPSFKLMSLITDPRSLSIS